MFGQAKPTFGASTSTGFGFGSFPFGSSATTNQPTTGLFGQTATSTPQSNMFAGSVFGGTPAAVQGTTVKFNPRVSTDTVQKNGQKVNVNTKHICITAMKEYQDKSLEELRVEDYAQNRKVGQSSGTTSIFGGGATTQFGFATSQANSSIFGASPATQPAQTSIFGASNNTGNSIFGLPQPTNTFGQTTQSSIFGSKPLFGAAASTTPSLNLTSAPQTGFGFGQTTPNSMFSGNTAFGVQPTTTASFSLFGSQPSSTQTGGFAFGKPTGTSIFAATTPTTQSLFGAPQTTSQISTFGAPAVSQSNSIFGNVKPAGTSIFGSPAVASSASAFGSGSSFGTGFGSKITAAPSGLFGTTPAVTSAFGLGNTNPSVGQTGLGTSLFGAKKITPFGMPTTSASSGFGFGTVTNAAAPSTNLFGTMTGFSGAASQPIVPNNRIFGNTNTSVTGGLFNKPAVTNFGFGQTSTPSLSIFGVNSSVAAPGTAVTAFGNASGGAPAFGWGGLTGNTSSPFAAAATLNQPAMAPLMEQLTQNARAQQHVLELVRSMPYGQSALFRHMAAEPVPPASSASLSTPTPSTNSVVKPAGGSVLSGTAAAITLAEMHKANSLSVGRSPGFIARKQMAFLPVNRRQLFTGFPEDDALMSAQSPVPGDYKGTTESATANPQSASSEKRFFIRRDEWQRLEIPRHVRNSIIERSSVVASQLEQQSIDNEEATSQNRNSQQIPQLGSGIGGTTAFNTVSSSKVQFLDSVTNTPLPSRKAISNENQENQAKTRVSTPSENAPPTPTMQNEHSDTANWTLLPDVTLNQTALTGPDDDDDEIPIQNSKNRAGVRLTKPGYYMFPTIEELDDLVDENNNCVVRDFVIGRQSYGHILFPGLTDITGIDLDDVVHIRRREVVVYPDDATKPPRGYGLNRKAEITLDGIWPTDKTTREFIKSPQRLASIRFDERLEKATQKMNATFTEYRPETGSWVFEVKHFSKYRLDDSDDESDPDTTYRPNVAQKNTHLLEKNQQLLPECENAVSGLTTTGEKEHLNPKQLPFEDAQMRSPQSSRAFQGVRDSLFFSAGPFRRGEEEDNVDFSGDDDDEHPRVGFFNGPSLLVKSESMTVKTHESETLEKSRHRSFAENADDDEYILTHFGVKLEAVQSVHHPIPLSCPSSYNVEKRPIYSINYARIEELLYGTCPRSCDLRGFYLDSVLSRGDVARLSWCLLRNKKQPSKHALLTVTPDSNSVLVSSQSSPIDADEEILLNAALQTSAQADTPTDSSVCPQFVPNNDPNVLNLYLTCTDQEMEERDRQWSPRMLAFRRALLVCQALWSEHDCFHDGLFSLVPGRALGLSSHFVGKRSSRGEAFPPKMEGEATKQKSYKSNKAISDFARRQAVSEWIRADLRPILDSRLKELGLLHLFKDDDVLPQNRWSLCDKLSKPAIYEGIFECLCCGEPAMACRLALACRMSHLASCLSMAAVSDPLCKRGLGKQLQVWNELKVLPFMPVNILRSYSLLAGVIQVPIIRAGGKTMLNVLAGVPYPQALGVHMWYLVDHSTDLATALKMFSNNWHAGNTLEVAPPRPLCDAELLRCGGRTSSVDTHSQDMLLRTTSRDVCYHLLRLASRPWHSLERTLDPSSLRLRSHQGGGIGNDWPSAWHLWRVLASVGRTSLNPVATSRLHAEFANFLETGGLWEWAVFVLMHEAEAPVRAAKVKQLLARHVTLQHPLRSQTGEWRLDEESVGQFSQSEYFILETFGIPIKWLHEAKACLARSLLASQSVSVSPESCMLLASLEAAHWLAAGHLEAAHSIYLKHILPEMMLHFNDASISSLLADPVTAARVTVPLANKLLTSLQPFESIPEENLPSSFDFGARIYLVYGRILHLAQQLALSCKARDDPTPGEADVDVERMCDTISVSEIIEQLKANTCQLTELLQSMDTPSVRERVVKSEMATTAVRLISTFLHPQISCSDPDSEMSLQGCISNDSVADGSQLLTQKLNMLANIDLPAELELAALESLSASGIAQRIF